MEYISIMDSYTLVQFWEDNKVEVNESEIKVWQAKETF